jgi:hypothetical protein
VAKKLVLKNVRSSFLTLGEPEQYQGKGVFRWSASFLVKKGDPQQAMVDKAIAEVATEKWNAKGANFLKGILGNKNLCCWLDGDIKSYDGYEGHFALSSHRPQDKGRPIVFDNDKSPIYRIDNTIYPGKEGRIYSGCFVNCEVELWAQDNANGKAIRCSLLGIQRFKDGDAFGGGSRPDENAFDEVEDGADAEDLA